MLNKNQSHKRNSWKYAVVLPLLVAFVICFQVKVIAQEKKEAPTRKNYAHAELTAISIDKNSTDVEMKKDAEMLLQSNGVVLKFSKIKRNSNGEITAIKIDYKDKDGTKGNSYTNGDKPIETITIYKTKNSIGISSDKDRYDVYLAKTNEDVADLVEKTDVVEATSADIENNDDNLNRVFIINGKLYTKQDLKGKNMAIVTGSISTLNPEEALKKYGSKAKDGAIIFEGKTEIIKSTFINNHDDDFPVPPIAPTSPTAPEIKFTTATPPNYPNPPTAPTGTPMTNEKEWKKFEKKMAQFEEKMEAMEPEMKAYTLKISNIDEQMKPFEKEMEVFEKKMEIFEKQMEEYQKKVEVYQEKNQKE
jgi:hypothetical protein